MYRARFYSYRYRLVLRRFYSTLAVLSLAAALVFLALLAGRVGVLPYFGNLIQQSAAGMGSWAQHNPRGIIRAALPLLAYANPDDEAEIMTPRAVLASVLDPFRLDIRSPLALLQSGMPMLAQIEIPDGEQTVPALAGAKPFKDPAAEQQATESQVAMTADNLVLIYHTHTGETYVLTDGMERLQGKRGGVFTVGAAMKEELEKKHGIRTVHSDIINDKIYDDSYIVAKKTAEELLKKNPAARVVVDIHRDAGKSRDNSLVKVNGKDTAPILFIVGSDKRAPFPNWKENYEFAKRLASKADEMYPGLCIGVRVKEGRFNQFLHPNAILLEMGSVSNSTEEAVYSAQLFADVLGTVVKEMLKDGKKAEPPMADNKVDNQVDTNIDNQVEDNVGEKD